MSTTLDNEVGRDRQHAATITSTVCVVIAAIFVVLRITARKMRGMRIGLDDWIEILSLALLAGLLTTDIFLIHYGSGLHYTSISSSMLINWSKFIFAFESLYVTTIFTIKTSLLLMYNRMFPTRQIRNASIILWTFSGLLTISIIFASVFQCSPIRKAWIPLLPGHCENLRATLIYSALPNVLTDFAILFLPIRLVWNMEIRRNQKYILTLVFMSGCLFIIGSVSRFIVLFSYKTSDFSWTILPPTTWSIIEASAGITTGCIPTLIPLLQPILSLFSTPSSPTPQEVTELTHKPSTSSHNPILTTTTSHISLDSNPNPNHKTHSSFQKPKSNPKNNITSIHKKLPNGGRRFRRLSSVSGGDKGSNYDTSIPSGSDILPLEVRVTTTIEVISVILSNDGRYDVPVRQGIGMPSEEVRMRTEMELGGFGFRHGYGPRGMNGWL